MHDNPSATDWNVEDGYQSKEYNTYPYRVFGANFKNSMQVYTQIILDDTFKYCRFVAPGFMLSLHNPDELPRFSNNHIFVPAEQHVLFGIKPKMVTSSRGLRKYSPQKRSCYFKSERKLRFFKSYSQQKCEMECLANFTTKEYDCVPFYMPSNLILQSIY